MKHLYGICRNCGYVGKSATRTKGSIVIELFTWILFILPGIIYSLWRLTTREQVCRKCGSTTIVPTNSPIGSEMLHKINEIRKPKLQPRIESRNVSFPEQ
jgi:hypothetical protein